MPPPEDAPGSNPRPLGEGLPTTWHWSTGSESRPDAESEDTPTEYDYDPDFDELPVVDEPNWRIPPTAEELAAAAAEDDEDEEDDRDDNDDDYVDDNEDDGEYQDEEDEDDEEMEDDDEEDEFEDAEEGVIPMTLRELLSSDEDGENGRVWGVIRALIGQGSFGPVLFTSDGDVPPRGLNPLQSDYPNPLSSNSEYEKVPSEEGAKLMESGLFGTSAYGADAKRPLSSRILERELGIGDRFARARNQALMAQYMLPTTKPEMVVQYDAPVYMGQFSDDGNFFFAGGHDFQVRMYDTSNPYDWHHYKTVVYPMGTWTLTDASLSPDNRWLAYTSIQSHVCLAPTDPNDTGDPYTLDLGDIHNQGRGLAGRPGRHGRLNFGIWSVRFSYDGRELVAGTNSRSIVVYDIESRRVLHVVEGHEDDVNAVCFADKSSPHVIYSGSDDATIKVWDRRSMSDERPAGAFVGHVEGITYIDSKGDGRYILSNGKDQTMKLWDLRMAMSTDAFAQKNPCQHTRDSDFDYRWHDYESWFKHPDDNSLVTFRGHKVLRTLIRCHFSPPGSTDSRYVYTGSQDGQVHIYNLDATVAGIINVGEATSLVSSRHNPSRYHIFRRRSAGVEPAACVRDVSWHPHAPVLVASAWSGYSYTHGTCTVHSYNQGEEDEGEPRMGRIVNEYLKDMEPHSIGSDRSSDESDNDM